MKNLQTASVSDCFSKDDLIFMRKTSNRLAAKDCAAALENGGFVIKRGKPKLTPTFIYE